MLKHLKDPWGDAANREEAGTKATSSNMEMKSWSNSQLSDTQSNALLVSCAVVVRVYF